MGPEVAGSIPANRAWFQGLTCLGCKPMTRRLAIRAWDHRFCCSSMTGRVGHPPTNQSGDRGDDAGSNPASRARVGRYLILRQVRYLEKP